MVSELIPKSDRDDCENVVSEVAMPLFDLRDTSLQALDQSNSTAGDLQSQVLLAYHGSETPARVFSRSFFESNQLGLLKCVQAFLPMPFFIGTIVGLELPAVLLSLHAEVLIFHGFLFLYIGIGVASLFCLLLTSIYLHRRRNRGRSAVDLVGRNEYQQQLSLPDFPEQLVKSRVLQTVSIATAVLITSLVYPLMPSLVRVFALPAVLIFSWWLSTKAIGRRRLSESADSMDSVLEPDHIALSPQGINLQWSSRFFSYMGLVLPWKRIALAYVEEHVDSFSNERYEILCIRDNVGKALRLDCREFASSVLIQALQKRAPWAVKAPPMVLALQPVQQFRLYYLINWALKIKWSLSEKSAAINDSTVLAAGSVLKRNKYKILETVPVRTFGTEHIAEVLSGKSGAESRPIAYKGLNINDQAVSSCSTRVKIQQFVLPPEQKFMQWYWLLSQFEREVRRLSCVNSNNITRWLDVFVENGSIFMVTEYDASQTLRELVKQTGPLPEARVREVALEMCEILLHLHQLDPPYVHKAFTPDALVLAKEGFVKLNRFALGHQLVPSQTFASYYDRRYISPEQLRDRASFQSDIYSFGCTLFYLLTGEDPKPLQQSNPKALRPELSDRFNEIVLKASEPAAGSRYDSAAAIKDAILELANSETRLALL